MNPNINEGERRTIGELFVRKWWSNGGVLFGLYEGGRNEKGEGK
jgi:hypothetical protein